MILPYWAEIEWDRDGKIEIAIDTSVDGGWRVKKILRQFGKWKIAKMEKNDKTKISLEKVKK